VNKRTVTWDQYENIYQAEVEELQRVQEEFLRHVGREELLIHLDSRWKSWKGVLTPCTECTAAIDVEDETITGTLCEVGRNIAGILEEHGSWKIEESKEGEAA
jgi:hypothetical protein